jgi:hypothetical protein
MLGAVRYGAGIFYAPSGNANYLNSLEPGPDRDLACYQFLQRNARSYSGRGVPRGPREPEGNDWLRSRV